MTHHHPKPRAKRAEHLDPFHRHDPLGSPIPFGEARELPILDGWAQWDLAVRLLQNNPPSPLVSAPGLVLE